MISRESITAAGGGRKRGKSHAIVHRLRQHIVHQLRPGSQLPTFGEMEQSFGVSRAVLREAVDRLKHDGFIYSIDRRGLYVADRPPHLSRFAFVFAQNPSSRAWPRFFTALQQEAAGLQQERGDISFVNYYDVGRDPRTESYEQLCRDAQAQRLAGLLVLPGCHEFAQCEPLISASVPKLFICGSTESGRTPSITVDTLDMCNRMVHWLRKDQQRRRIAAVAMWENSAMLLDHLESRGILRRHWALTVGRDNATDVEKLVTLLMDYPGSERPDGLMILDDNLTERALFGLVRRGLKIGEEISVIAHCNWPWAVPCLAPVQRVGFHARHLLEVGVHCFERIQAGEPLDDQQIKLPALFEEESLSPAPALAGLPVASIPTESRS